MCTISIYPTPKGVSDFNPYQFAFHLLPFCLLFPQFKKMSAQMKRSRRDTVISAADNTPDKASATSRIVKGNKKRKDITQSTNRPQKKKMVSTTEYTAQSVGSATSSTVPATPAAITNGSTSPVLPEVNQSSLLTSPMAIVASTGIRSTNRSYFPTVNPSASQFIPPSPSHCSTNSKYTSRSILSPNDLTVTAVLETTCRMMEKYLLTERPFPTDAEFILVAFRSLFQQLYRKTDTYCRQLNKSGHRHADKREWK